jgi:lysophospholipase L1-like esterase
LLFIGVILLFFAGMQELFCRWLLPLPEVADFNRITYTKLKLFGAELSAARHRGLFNVKIRWECEPDGFAFDHTLNLYGFRGPNFRIAPPGDRPRILFVGDSFVESCGAADEDTLTRQFTRTLGASHAVDAINLGVIGADLPEYQLLVHDAVHLLKPDTVFLVLSSNDLPASPIPPRAMEPPPDFPKLNPWIPRAYEAITRYRAGLTVPSRWPSGPFPFFAAVPAESNLLTTQKPPDNIDARVLEAMRKGKANPWNANLGAYYADWLRHDFKTGGGVNGHLANLAKLCRQDRSRLVVAYVPFHASLNPVYFEGLNKLGGPQHGPNTRWDGGPFRNKQHHLKAVCDELKLPLLDTTGPFLEAEKTQGRLFWPIDGHCNSKGYALLATVCANYWTDRKVPPEAPETNP